MSEQNTQFQDDIEQLDASAEADIDAGTDAEDRHSIDDVGFSAPMSRSARPPRKAMEPGVLRSLTIAALVGVGIGAFLWMFKPSPKAADASPIRASQKLQNAQPVPSGGLFELPEWNEAAYQRDKAAARP